MPIYEYRCAPCDTRFEAFLAAAADAPACPRCGGSDLKRLMSTFAASVPGGYKAAQMGAPAPATGEAAPKAGGCGGGCACH